MNVINDIRLCKDFKGISFSGYKLTEVKSTLLKSIQSSKLEESCYWSAELICSGHFKDLWELIIYYYSKHIHIINPKLSIYLDNRIDKFIKILNNQAGNIELILRNNHGIRILFCEIICVLCDSKQGHVYTDIKITSIDCDLSQIREKLRAPNITYLTDIFSDEDPKELYIAVNELCYQLSPSGKCVSSACYWIEWIMEYTKQCKLKNKKIMCSRKAHIPVKPEYQKDVIWLIWDSLLLYANKQNISLLTKIINSLLNIYCIRYNGIHCFNKKKYVLYCAVSCILSPDSVNVPILTDDTKSLITKVTNNIDNIYNQIKKNEQAPNTDYLFNNVNTNNIEKTINQLNMIHSMSTKSTTDPDEDDDYADTR